MSINFDSNWYNDTQNERQYGSRPSNTNMNDFNREYNNARKHISVATNNNMDARNPNDGGVGLRDDGLRGLNKRRIYQLMIPIDKVVTEPLAPEANSQYPEIEPLSFDVANQMVDEFRRLNGGNAGFTLIPGPMHVKLPNDESLDKDTLRALKILGISKSGATHDLPLRMIASMKASLEAPSAENQISLPFQLLMKHRTQLLEKQCFKPTII